MTLNEVLDQLRQAQRQAERGCTCSYDPDWGYLGRCVHKCAARNLQALQESVAVLLRWTEGY